MYYDYNNENQQNGGYTPYSFTGGPQQNYGAYTAPEPKRNRKKHSGLKTAAIALSCSLIGGLVGAGITGGTGIAGGHTVVYESDRAPVAVDVAHRSGSEQLTAAEVYAANVNSTVGITTSVVTTNFFGFRTAAAASGSGFIISEDGYIVTNYHVIEGASSIKVTTYDGTSYDAAFVGGDETNDLAILKIEAAGLSAVTLGDSSTANVGDDVVAIGNPLGELTFSLTKGSVSALNREITLSSGVTMNLIQTDAAINSGNSGGALFNLYGEVIGITNAKYSSGSAGEATIDNIGFAIPINSVKDIITSIIETGYIAKPYIGVALSETESGGVAVRSVEADGPAAEAGIQAGDIITAVDGDDVARVTDVSEAVAGAGVDGAVSLSILRGDEPLTVTVTVGEQKRQATTQTGGEDAQTDDAYDDYGFPFGFSGGMRRG